MTGTTRHTTSRIPSFATVDEEAAFWQTHSSADFADELAIVTDVTFVKALPKKGLTVRLEPAALDLLAEQARSLGMSPSTLARQWILERLQSYLKEHPSAPLVEGEP
jgi:hypothetical protein